MVKIDVLGTQYTVKRVNAGQDEFLEKMQYGGYCDNSAKTIVILNLKSVPEWKDEPEKAIKQQESETIRHELIHAFLNESGLRYNAFAAEKSWPRNEEMVDWIAIQFPKILKAFRDADAI